MNPANDEQARIDEALVCTRQKNTQTGIESEPYDVMVPKTTLFTTTGVVRSPTPSEVNSLPNTQCTDWKFRDFDAGPLPGLSAPGR